jgi:hypothetical protein
MVMKPAAFCLLLALTLSAQAIPEDSAISRIESALQRINAATVHEPISLVIVVQTKDTALGTLAWIHEIGPLLEPLVTGERGEFAVLSYGDQIRTVQPFTSDSATVSHAIDTFKVFQTAGPSVRMNDAVDEAISDLDARPVYRRRIILVIGDGNDRRSRTNFQDVRARAKRLNVLIYELLFAH